MEAHHHLQPSPCHLSSCATPLTLAAIAAQPQRNQHKKLSPAPAHADKKPSQNSSDAASQRRPQEGLRPEHPSRPHAWQTFGECCDLPLKVGCPNSFRALLLHSARQGAIYLLMLFKAREGGLEFLRVLPVTTKHKCGLHLIPGGAKAMIFTHIQKWLRATRLLQRAGIIARRVHVAQLQRKQAAMHSSEQHGYV
jgi:hypothetical protein